MMINYKIRDLEIKNHGSQILQSTIAIP